MYPWVEKKNSKRPFIILFLIILLISIIASIYSLYPTLSYYFISNTYLRLENNALRIEKRILAANEPIQVILNSLEQANKLTELTVKKNSDEALAYYYAGLFYYYELFLRVNQDEKSLIDLCGRGLLPVHVKIIEQNLIVVKPILPLARKVIVMMNKALAIEPNFIRKVQAKLILSYSYLILTGRTDKKFLKYIEEVKNIELTPLLNSSFEWVSIAYYSLLGMKKELIDFFNYYNTNINKISLKLDENSRDFLLAQGLYFSKDYISALKSLNKILAHKDTNTPKYLLTEILRLEAEITLIQRGKLAAKPLFEKAFVSTEKKDEFIAERINEIYGSIAKK